VRCKASNKPVPAATAMHRALVVQALSETMCWGAAAVAGEDIQDLTVMSQPPPGQQKSSVPDDPAIISAVSSRLASQQDISITLGVTVAPMIIHQ
jgi:hypothetical protein